MKVINISGYARAGKDTASKMLKAALELKGKKVLITHYSGLLKYICYEYTDWDGQKTECGRTLLQYVGTDVIRKWDPNYWVDFVADMLDFFGSFGKWDYVLIPDCRFPNEIERLKERDFDVVHLNIVREAFDNGLTSAQQMHESEVALDGVIPDYTITNDGDLMDLRSKIDMWVMEELNEKK